jgi:hypothetical protein
MRTPQRRVWRSCSFKVDFFSARAFPLGIAELDRAVFLDGSGLSESTAPFVTPEDILLARMHWFRMGGEVSEMQWRDVQGIVRGRGATLDREYLEEGARKPGILPLLARALTGAERPPGAEIFPRGVAFCGEVLLNFGSSGARHKNRRLRSVNASAWSSMNLDTAGGLWAIMGAEPGRFRVYNEAALWTEERLSSILRSLRRPPLL